MVFVSLGTVLGLVLCFSNYSFKEKPYLYVRNALLGAFGALFLTTMLLEGSFDGESLNGVGFSAMVQSMKSIHAWWETVIKILTPLVVALTTIFLAELPKKVYETVSALLAMIPLACGLYVSPNMSNGMFVGLVAAYSIALAAVGLLLFKVYLCIETAAVGGFLASWLIKCFYSLSTITFVVAGSVLAVAGAVISIAFANRKGKKGKTQWEKAPIHDASDVGLETNDAMEQEDHSQSKDTEENGGQNA